MKTPREILLERHRAVEPKLDAIRKDAVASFSQRASRDAKPLALRAALIFWHELILPCGRVWAGLAVVWVVILVLNLPGDGKAAPKSAMAAPPGREVLAILREQRLLLARLLEPSAPSPADRPKTPGPRGALVQTVMYT